MARILAASLLSVLLSQAFCLQCNTCQGEYDCVGETVTCKDPWASCTTSVRKASVSFMDFQTIKKGCARQLYPHESVSLNSHMMSLSYVSRFCSEDGCNNETYFVSHPPPANHMRCHTCATQGPWCPEGARSQISCVGDQDQCVNLDVTGHLSQLSNMKLKGCANLPNCQDTLSFYSGTRTIHATCCDTPLCNSFTPDLHLQSQPTNGLECYSCADGDGSESGCSAETLSTVQCTGIHNMCLEGIGKSRKGNKDLGVMIFKGCASEAMCHSSLLALVQELDDPELLCCQGSLCNTRIVNGVVTEPKVVADSPTLSEDAECMAPSATASSSDHTSSPACVDEDEEDAGVVRAPPGVAATPGSHVENETSTVDHDGILAYNSTGHENKTTSGNTATTSLHPGKEATDEHESHDDMFTGYSEVETPSPAGATVSGPTATESSSATTNLEKNGAGAGNTSSSNHGNVVVLIPIIVPRRNATAATTSSSSEATNANKVLGMANDEEAGCEEEEEGVGTGEHFVASEERDGAPSQSPESTAVLGDDHSSADVFTAEGHGSTHSPATGAAGNTNVDKSHIGYSHGTTGERTPHPGHSGEGSHGATNVGATGGENFAAGGSTAPDSTVHPLPYVISKENDTFAIGSDSPDREVLVSGSGAGTSRPKNKIPCKRPGTQGQPDMILMSSPSAEKRAMGDGISRSDTSHLEHNVPGKTHFPDKTNTYSGAFGLAANLGLFSLTLFLATLLH